MWFKKEPDARRKRIEAEYSIVKVKTLDGSVEYKVQQTLEDGSQRTLMGWGGYANITLSGARKVRDEVIRRRLAQITVSQEVVE